MLAYDIVRVSAYDANDSFIDSYCFYLLAGDRPTDPDGGSDEGECQHTYEDGDYYSDDNNHYKECDNCDYYDPATAEAHYEAIVGADHRCDVCDRYVRVWCTPIDAETDHYCSNGDNCGVYLEDLCTDVDNNHYCDGCATYLKQLCADENNDHICDEAACGVTLSKCIDNTGDFVCDICDTTLPIVAWNDVDDDGVIDEGESRYAFLDGAFDDEDATIIKLAANAVDFSYVVRNKTATLDLNGYTVALCSWFDICDSSIITIKDSSQNKSGRIVGDYGASAFMDVYATGELVLESGTVDTLRLCYDVAAVTLNGGTVSTMMTIEGMLTLGDTTVTEWLIWGGTFNVDPSTLEGFDNNSYEVIDNGNGTWTVQEKTTDDGECKHVTMTDWAPFDGTQHYSYCTDCGGNEAYDDHTGGTATCSSNAKCEVCCNDCGELSTSHASMTDWFPYDDTQHFRYCADCSGNMEFRDHYGGTADCVNKAVCEVCNRSYGEKSTEHQWDEFSWFNYNQHFRRCTVTGCQTGAEYAPHYGGDGSCWPACDGCGGDFRDVNGEYRSMGDWYFYDDTQHFHYCEDCGGNEEFDDHSGGTATTTELAVCEYCGEEYGELADPGETEFFTLIFDFNGGILLADIEELLGEYVVGSTIVFPDVQSGKTCLVNTFYIEGALTKENHYIIGFEDQDGVFYSIAESSTDEIIINDNVTLTVQWAAYGDNEGDEELTGVSLYESNLTLDGNIGLNFYFLFGDDVLAMQDAFVRFSLEDGRVINIPVSEGIACDIDTVTYYKFTCELYAKQMADIVKVQVFNGETAVNDEFEHSIVEYANLLFEMAQVNLDYAEVKPLIEAMLDYGANAQLYFGYNTSKLANAGLDPVDLSVVTASTLESYKATGMKIEGIGKFISSNLVLDSETTLKLYFLPDEGVDASAIKFEVGTETLTPTTYGEYLVISITNIKSDELDNEFTVTKGTEAQGSFTTSVYAYCYNVLLDQQGLYNDAIKNTIKARYIYNMVAVEYFG